MNDNIYLWAYVRVHICMWIKFIMVQLIKPLPTVCMHGELSAHAYASPVPLAVACMHIALNAPLDIHVLHVILWSCWCTTRPPLINSILSDANRKLKCAHLVQVRDSCRLNSLFCVLCYLLLFCLNCQSTCFSDSQLLMGYGVKVSDQVTFQMRITTTVPWHNGSTIWPLSICCTNPHWHHAGEQTYLMISWWHH